MLLSAPQPDDPPRLPPLPLNPGEPFPCSTPPMLVEVIGGGLRDPPGEGIIPISGPRLLQEEDPESASLSL